jgi:hypothetical protein
MVPKYCSSRYKSGNTVTFPNWFIGFPHALLRKDPELTGFGPGIALQLPSNWRGFPLKGFAGNHQRCFLSELCS